MVDFSASLSRCVRVLFNGVEMNDDADAAVEHDKENAISHRMKIPHHPQDDKKLSGLC